jgi:hypothetical protein
MENVSTRYLLFCALAALLLTLLLCGAGWQDAGITRSGKFIIHGQQSSYRTDGYTVMPNGQVEFLTGSPGQTRPVMCWYPDVEEIR